MCCEPLLITPFRGPTPFSGRERAVPGRAPSATPRSPSSASGTILSAGSPRTDVWGAAATRQSGAERGPVAAHDRADAKRRIPNTGVVVEESFGRHHHITIHRPRAGLHHEGHCCSTAVQGWYTAVVINSSNIPCERVFLRTGDIRVGGLIRRCMASSEALSQLSGPFKIFFSCSGVGTKRRTLCHQRKKKYQVLLVSGCVFTPPQRALEPTEWNIICRMNW